jgi:hypothetical protein
MWKLITPLCFDGVNKKKQGTTFSGSLHLLESASFTLWNSAAEVPAYLINKSFIDAFVKSHRLTAVIDWHYRFVLSWEVSISMDGKDRAMDNIFIERLWPSLKYEEIYTKEYSSVAELKRAL